MVKFRRLDTQYIYVSSFKSQKLKLNYGKDKRQDSVLWFLL